MATTTNKVRTAIRSRLDSLRVEDGKQSNIRAVLNPAEAREKGKRPLEGLYAVLWTEPAKVLESRPGSVLWQQPFAIDIPVKWGDDAEAFMDVVRAEIAAALLEKIEGVRSQELSEFITQYPQGGNSGVISVVITTEYVENI